MPEVGSRVMLVESTEWCYPIHRVVRTLQANKDDDRMGVVRMKIFEQLPKGGHLADATSTRMKSSLLSAVTLANR